MGGRITSTGSSVTLERLSSAFYACFRHLTLRETAVVVCSSPDVDRRAFVTAWARGIGTAAEWAPEGEECTFDSSFAADPAPTMSAIHRLRLLGFETRRATRRMTRLPRPASSSRQPLALLLVDASRYPLVSSRARVLTSG